MIPTFNLTTVKRSPMKLKGVWVSPISEYRRIARKPSILIDFTHLFAEMRVGVISVSEQERAADNTAEVIVERFCRELILSRMRSGSFE